jgi:hypothetical protein
MILVFKTNVKTLQQVNQLKPKLDSLLPKSKWNFDLQDCDNIFRVKGDSISSSAILNLFSKLDFFCEELL